MTPAAWAPILCSEWEPCYRPAYAISCFCAIIVSFGLNPWKGHNNMIKNIVFDIGGVLTNFRPYGFLADEGYSLVMQERLMNATFGNPSWGEYDLGNLSEDTILNLLIASDPELEDDIRDIARDLSRMILPVDFAIPWIKDLKARGYMVYYLSNYSEKAIRDTKDKALSFLPYLDGGIMSCFVHSNKPDTGIYNALLEKYDLKPEECVFLDDTPHNLVTAEKLGFYTIEVRKHRQAAGDLEELLAAHGLSASAKTQNL